MPEGTIAFYNPEKGFGFIESDGRRYFVHATYLVDRQAALNSGDRVAFETAPNPGGSDDAAVEVRLLRQTSDKPVRHRGVVASFDAAQGFGIVLRDDTNEEVFVHWKRVEAREGNRVVLEEGEELEFDIGVPDGARREQAVNVRRIDPRPQLLKFGSLPPLEQWLERLAEKAEPENWDEVGSDGVHRYEVLRSYIMQTFSRLTIEDKADPGKKIALGEADGHQYACFNTGLVTRNQLDIFALFQGPEEGRRFHGFYNESDQIMHGKFHALPALADYFTDSSVLLYDRKCELYLNVDHIIDQHLERFPENMRGNPFMARTSLDGACERARKRVYRNYKTAVPQYYHGSIQLLLPLCLQDPVKPDLALVVSRNGQQYRGDTVLPLQWAYKNARLLCRPDSDWLKAETSHNSLG